MSTYRRSAATTRRLPYPIDLDTFRPDPERKRNAGAAILWVGRVVPRSISSSALARG